MRHNYFTKKKDELVPGTAIKCESGRYIAFYEHRTDIIANGDNEIEAKKNLKEMYTAVTQFEKSENHCEPHKKFKAKGFLEKFG
ncbi:hypothetical protein [Agriterribacter sp.]|uniref:hypothetical protein n=1 Tax=Agriterribacter sp. TaxID=2821509 RepID=UPI002BBCF263|nr:hypothetical protein [Agriterribacter sp.]HRO48149.1 hypothetical protein [Agriterribacter sp.]HRQ16243.1 hypothetical protein [Agriterribacter sp.]